MFADADLVENATEAVKKMQELEAGQSQFHSAREHFKGRINYPSTRQQQDNMDNATILAEQYDELIAIYKKIDISVFVKFPKFWLKKISELAIKHYELLVDSSYTNNMSYGEISEPLREIHDDFFQVVALIGVTVVFDDNYEKLNDAAQNLNRKIEEFGVLENSMTEKLKSWEMDILKLKEEIAEILQSARGASAEAGAFAHATFFEEQAKKHKREQMKWLKLSGVMIAVLLIYLAVSYCFSSLPDVWAPTTILQAAIRAFAFSLLLFVLIFCVKNYRAHQHNYVVNTHRANSLRTYRAIIEGATSPDAQDIILANAAQHIFTPLDTGYVKGADSVGNPTVEIIRSGVKLVDGKE